MKSPVLAAFVVALVAAGALAAPAEASDRKPATMVLNALPVAPAKTDGYSRDNFADWYDADSNGCDTREEVLMAEAVAGRIIDCSVTGGEWYSVYDGVRTTNPSTFDIDHRVPLAEAWASGAWRWTPDKRRLYANDLGYAPALIAVSASSNRSKGDRDPSEWLPPLASQRCSYAKQWIGVKYRWGLSVDAAEKSTLTRMLNGCAPLMVVPKRVA